MNSTMYSWGKPITAHEKALLHWQHELKRGELMDDHELIEMARVRVAVLSAERLRPALDSQS